MLTTCKLTTVTSTSNYKVFHDFQTLSFSDRCVIGHLCAQQIWLLDPLQMMCLTQTRFCLPKSAWRCSKNISVGQQIVFIVCSANIWDTPTLALCVRQTYETRLQRKDKELTCSSASLGFCPRYLKHFRLKSQSPPKAFCKEKFCCQPHDTTKLFDFDQPSLLGLKRSEGVFELEDALLWDEVCHPYPPINGGLE